MSTPTIADIENLGAPLFSRSTLTVTLATSQDDIHQCQRLRYQVFADEMGARLHNKVPGLDADDFDEYCMHLMVTDTSRNQLIATTRLLSSEAAARAGHFYSETEFDISNILRLKGNMLEVGRTCVHPDYRNGASLPMLWQGLARLVVLHEIDYLMGCASMPLSHGPIYLNSIMAYIRHNHYAPEELRVIPRHPLPLEYHSDETMEVILPTLLKAYLKQGALICGEPCLDTDFQVADAFVLLGRDKIADRYVRHFIDRD
jgi:putative hemolysin